MKKPWWKIWGGEGSRFVEGKQTSGDEIKDSSTENITPTTVVELPKVVTTFPKAPEEPQSRSALENADNVVTLPKVMRQPADVATPPSEVPPDVAATPTEAPPEIVWHVVNVRADDPHQLNVHSEAGGQSKVIGHIPWDAKNLLVIERAYNGPDLWFLTRYGDNEGWVHSAFVTRD